MTSTAKEIVQHFAYPLVEVEQMLHMEIGLLEQAARIKDFVPLLAGKQVKDLLMQGLRTAPRPAKRSPTKH